LTGADFKAQSSRLVYVPGLPEGHTAASSADSIRSLREHVFVSKYAPRGAPSRTRLEELARDGATLRDIAVALDRSIATIRYWLRRWNIARPDARKTRVDPATAPREVMRVCSRHRRAVFRLDARGTYRCVLCSQERVAERRRQIKRILIEEAGGCCAVCGYDRLPAALHFHHLDAAEKSFGLSARGLSRGIARVREEARKCVLLCGNCHVEVEAGVRVLEAPRGGFEPPRTD
jgi:5-methylcytosine-specific restriction endonuclease McrA